MTVFAVVAGAWMSVTGSISAGEGSVGDRFPPRCEVIDVRVGSIGQPFNAIDPSPFRARDLRSDVEAFIVDWGREAHRDTPLACGWWPIRAEGRLSSRLAAMPVRIQYPEKGPT